MAMAMMLLAGAVAFSTTFQARKQYDADTARVDLNQNLRSATDMITMMVRQAGSRVGDDFPALELVDNAAGDRLTVRHHMLEAVLLSCTDRTAGDTTIVVGRTAGVGGCSILGDNDADGYPDNVQEYREYRLQYGTGSGPTVLSNGYIYDPITRSGEFFSFRDELENGGTGDWYLNLTGGGLTTAYPAVNQPRIYVLEESRFDLTAGTIELRRNGGTAALAVVDGVVDFQVALFMQDATVATALPSTGDWTGIETVQVQLAGARALDGRTITRTLTADVFPRNILSY